MKRQILFPLMIFIMLTGIVSASSMDQGSQKSNPKKPKIGLLANFIDFELAIDFFGFLGNKGMEVIDVNAGTFDQYKMEKFIVILGGPDAYDDVGEIVQEVLTLEEQEFLRTHGNKKMYTKTNVWKQGQVVRVIAGSDRNQTKKAHEENRENLSQRIISESEEEEVVEVKIKGFEFTPLTKTVSLGTTVKWTNEDSAPHTATSVDTTFNSGTLSKGNSWNYTFNIAGTFEYRCNIHPSMQHGKIIVQ